MCGTLATVDELAVVRGARLVADDVLRGLGLPLRKALDLSTPQGFDRAVAGMAAELRRAASASDHEAVRDAIAVLDLDWHRTTAQQRRELVARALAAAGRSEAATAGTRVRAEPGGSEARSTVAPAASRAS